jgi:hypothetical protein
MLGNPQKAGLNTSQYDFKGVAVIFILHRPNLHLAHINQLHPELEEILVQQLEDQFRTEE